MIRSSELPRRTEPLPAGALGNFDWLRGLAATLVLAGHVRGLFLVDFSDIPHPTFVARMAYMITGVGHQAVVVFFVLSGFFIGYGVLGSWNAGRFSLHDYATRRLTRIYVVLFPALVVTFLIDHLGMWLFGTAQNIYGGEVRAPFLELPFIPDSLRFGVLIGNIFQLQSIMRVPEYGTNGPLWSLPYEAWAYVMFPLGVAAIAQPRARMSIVSAAICIAMLALGGSRLWLYFSIWLFGAAVAWWWMRRARSADVGTGSWTAVVVALAIFFAVIVVSRGRLLKARSVEDLMVGVSTAGLLITLLRRPGAWTAGPTARSGAWLAGFSYSIYLFHKPAIAFLHAAMLGPDRWQPTLEHTLLAAIITAAVMLAWCYPLSLVTERHTNRVRAWVQSQLPGDAPQETAKAAGR